MPNVTLESFAIIPDFAGSGVTPILSAFTNEFLVPDV